MTTATLTTKTETVTATLNEKNVTVNRVMVSGNEYSFSFPTDSKKAFKEMGVMLTQPASKCNPLVCKAYLQVSRETDAEEMSGNQLKKAFEPIQLAKRTEELAIAEEAKDELMELAGSQRLKSGKLKLTYDGKSNAELVAIAKKYRRIAEEAIAKAEATAAEAK